MNLLLIGSSLAALYTALLTQTRGAWLVLPVAALLFLWIVVKRYRGQVRRRVLAITIASVFIGVLGLSSSDIFQNRYQAAIQSWDLYWQGDIQGSVGLRFLKWEAAYNHWQSSPLLGSGLGDYWYDTKILAKDDPRFAPIVEFSEAHSLYFEFLATSGVVGLLVMLWVLFWKPIRLFYCYADARYGPIVQYLAFDGILIVVAVLNDGISQNWLSRNPLTSAYIFFLVVFLSGIARLAVSPPAADAMKTG